MNWQGEIKVVHLQMISEVTGIPIVVDENQIPRNLEEYMLLISTRTSQVGVLLQELFTETCILCVGG